MGNREMSFDSSSLPTILTLFVSCILFFCLTHFLKSFFHSLPANKEKKILFFIYLCIVPLTEGGGGADAGKEKL
jgi:hypothetical protein